MSEPLSSFPNRPLRRAEVDTIEANDAVRGIFPMYGKRPTQRDGAFVLVLHIREKAKVVAYDGSGWQLLTTLSLPDSNGDGGDFPIIEELHSEAARFINNQSDGISIEF